MYPFSSLKITKQGKITSYPTAVNHYFFAVSFSAVNFYISSVFYSSSLHAVAFENFMKERIAEKLCKASSSEFCVDLLNIVTKQTKRRKLNTGPGISEMRWEIV